MTDSASPESEIARGYDGMVGIICTGGTFDKTYDPITERLVMRRDPAARQIVEAAQLDNVSIQSVVNKDSLDLTAEEFDLIRRAIRSTRERRLVVIHGTSRLVDSAVSVADTKGKTVVFTGAMVPASIGASEASFNLGFAIACARVLAPGVWVAMNGEVFDPRHVRKNLQAGRFERIR
jgi:L-asparaginase